MDFARSRRNGRGQNRVIGLEVRDGVVLVPRRICACPVPDFAVPIGGMYSNFIPGCTPVQPVVQLNKAFFVFAMKDKKL
jgi:hypothetical protein